MNRISFSEDPSRIGFSDDEKLPLSNMDAYMSASLTQWFKHFEEVLSPEDRFNELNLDKLLIKKTFPNIAADFEGLLADVRRKKQIKLNYLDSVATCLLEAQNYCKSSNCNLRLFATVLVLLKWELNKDEYRQRLRHRFRDRQECLVLKDRAQHLLYDANDNLSNIFLKVFKNQVVFPFEICMVVKTIAVLREIWNINRSKCFGKIGGESKTVYKTALFEEILRIRKQYPGRTAEDVWKYVAKKYRIPVSSTFFPGLLPEDEMAFLSDEAADDPIMSGNIYEGHIKLPINFNTFRTEYFRKAKPKKK